MKKPPKPAKVTGRCFRATCERKAKILYDCRLCGHAVKACQFHRDRAMTTLRDHVMTQHPAEFSAARHGATQEPVPSPIVTVDAAFDVGYVDPSIKGDT